MKIISGKYKGRILDGFTLEKTRPTMDRVKESLFAMIQDNIDNSIVLDLFAGSGNLGLEALSQGAKEVYFVDKNKKAIEVIKRNISNLGVENAIVIEGDYLKVLKIINNKIDIVFLDPPYHTNYIALSINAIDEFDLLSSDGLIVCETDDLKNIKYPSNYQVLKEKKYGNKYVVILKKI